MSDSELANSIDRLVQQLGWCLAWHKSNLTDVLRVTATVVAPDSPAETWKCQQLRELQRHEMDALVATRPTLKLLIPELERIGYDTTTLLMVRHCIDGGGGPHNAFPLWPNLKVSLQRLAVRLREGQGNGAGEKGNGSERKPSKQKPKRGAQQKYSPDDDAKLIENWKAAKRQRTTRDDFCRRHGITVKQLIQAQDRQRFHNGIGAE